VLRRSIPLDLRDVDLDYPVEVYWNLTRHRWSVRQGGLVRAHLDDLVLRVTEWRVQPGGQRRVRETGRKNVHAFAVGRIPPTFASAKPAEHRQRTRDGWTGERVVYDPHRDDGFVAIPHHAGIRLHGEDPREGAVPAGPGVYHFQFVISLDTPSPRGAHVLRLSDYTPAASAA